MSTARPLDVLAPVIDRIEENATERFALDIARLIRGAYDAPAKGTMRAWMEAHHGDIVTTVQVNRDTGQAWSPTGRTVDATRAGSVQLSGSTRDYKGMRVLHATDDVLIVSDSWHVIAYVDENAASVER